MKKISNVVLQIEQDRQYGRDIIRGVAGYARHFGPWSFISSPPFYLNSKIDDRLTRLLDQGLVDGIIMRESPLLERITASKIPVIILPHSDRYYHSDYPVLLGDDEQSACLAAEHLLERGLRNFAYCGFAGFPWSVNRCRSFVKRIASAGYSVNCFDGAGESGPAGWPDEKAEMISWLHSLDKPVGIMACLDDRSRHLAEACNAAGIRIPDDAAIIGVDDDALVCELSEPPLSSVALDSVKAGYEAASLLAGMMSGESGSGQRIIASVRKVNVRQSTDILAIEDIVVSEALTYIRDNSNRIINVEDVVAVSGMSRRGLEKRFSIKLGKTVHSEICRFRADLIARVLIETDFPISRIALDLGYTSEDHIARFFRKEMGETPLQYRKRYR